YRSTKDMTPSDYVTSANTIPGASLTDYFQCLSDSLECEISDSSPVQRRLKPLNGGGFRLELVMTLQFLRSTWVVKYAFDLEPVPLERIDVVESNLRDQQDALERIRGELSAAQTPPFLRLEASRTRQYSTLSCLESRLCWNKAHCAEFAVNGEDGVIKILRQGVYRIGGVVNCAPTSYGKTVMLLKNGVCIQQNYCAYMGSNHYVSTSLDAIVLLEEGDMLTITCGTKTVTTSYCSIVGIVA
ncbi:hypothetical protein PHYSODRAFT_531862, partial [Phytophthora sojae]